MNIYSIKITKFEGLVNESSCRIPKNLTFKTKKKLTNQQIFEETYSYMSKNYGVILVEATINPAVQKATKRMAKKMSEWLEMSEGGELEYIFMNEDGTFDANKIDEIAKYFQDKYNKQKIANVKKAISMCKKYLTDEGVIDMWNSRDKKCLKALFMKVNELSPIS